MTFKDLVAIILGYITTIVVLLLAVIVIVFIFKVVQGIAKSDSADSRKKLRDSMIFGIVGIFFAVSFFAIAKWISAGLGF